MAKSQMLPSISFLRKLKIREISQNNYFLVFLVCCLVLAGCCFHTKGGSVQFSPYFKTPKINFCIDDCTSNILCFSKLINFAVFIAQMVDTSSLFLSIFLRIDFKQRPDTVNDGLKTKLYLNLLLN